MFSKHRKHRTRSTTPIRKGLKPLAARQAIETVGGRNVQPDTSGVGGNGDSDLSHRFAYEQA